MPAARANRAETRRAAVGPLAAIVRPPLRPSRPGPRDGPIGAGPTLAISNRLRARFRSAAARPAGIRRHAPKPRPGAAGSHPLRASSNKRPDSVPVLWRSDDLSRDRVSASRRVVACSKAGRSSLRRICSSVEASQLSDEIQCAESAGDGISSASPSAGKRMGRFEGAVQIAAAKIGGKLGLQEFAALSRRVRKRVQLAENRRCVVRTRGQLLVEHGTQEAGFSFEGRLRAGRFPEAEPRYDFAAGPPPSVSSSSAAMRKSSGLGSAPANRSFTSFNRTSARGKATTSRGPTETINRPLPTRLPGRSAKTTLVAGPSAPRSAAGPFSAVGTRRVDRLGRVIGDGRAGFLGSRDAGPDARPHVDRDDAVLEPAARDTAFRRAARSRRQPRLSRPAKPPAGERQTAARALADDHHARRRPLRR